MLPHFLLKFGLKKTLQRLAEQTQKSLGNPCTFNCKITDELKLNQHYLIHFYSIILELLNNLLKHSHPHSVQFELEKSQTHLFLNIKHDGVAINQYDYEYLLNHSDGMGLESISLRLKLINGELLYQRYSPGGTIQLAMPLTETNLSDEKINLFAVGYNLGPVTAQLQYKKVDNHANVTGYDGEQIGAKLSTKF
jgi:signal transduction histidine kinase